jgi:hypothetical protein
MFHFREVLELLLKILKQFNKIPKRITLEILFLNGQKTPGACKWHGSDERLILSFRTANMKERPRRTWNNFLSNELTSQNTVLLENQKGFHLVKKFPYFDVTRRFIVCNTWQRRNF